MEIEVGHPLAVLVDGDNIAGKLASGILAIAKTHGDPSVVRVYLDAQRSSDWHDAVGYRMLHAGTGKNAADILLALDAMELALSRAVRAFVIATSDGDFVHIAIRLRELGAKVIGVGEAKAPKAFRANCTEFVELGAQQDKAQAPAKVRGAAPLEQKICAMIASHQVKGGGLRITDLGPRMHVQHGIKISTFPEKTWRAYLEARPTLFEIDPRGTEARVRLRPEGSPRPS